jgi:non-ribosomal peptide synthetase component E (peptide arylation enzyme)
VIPHPGESLTFGDMIDYLLQQQLAKQYLPERLEIVAEFPMTPSGKVQKYQLRQHIAMLLEREGVRPSGALHPGTNGSPQNAKKRE